MEIIYIDSLFFLNLITDYLLCLGAGRVCGLRLRRGRYAAAAALGALYAVSVWLPGLAFLSAPLMKLASGLAMGLVAYGAERRPLRCTAVFFAVSAAFGGTLWAVSLAAGGNGRVCLDPKALVLSFAVCYAALRLLFRCLGRLPEKRRASVRAELLGREAAFTALVDTGNSLTDPLTGTGVLVACPQALRPILREYTELFALPASELLELAGQIPELRGRLRLIPYTAVGVSGLLPAFRPERLRIDGRPEELLIAVSPQAAGDGFEAIL